MARYAKLSAVLVALLGVGAVGVYSADAFNNAGTTNDVPRVIPYQGTLAANQKNVDGTRKMSFGLYAGAKQCANGQNPEWSMKSPVPVNIEDGRFSVALGTQNAQNPM